MFMKHDADVSSFLFLGSWTAVWLLILGIWLLLGLFFQVTVHDFLAFEINIEWNVKNQTREFFSSFTEFECPRVVSNATTKLEHIQQNIVQIFFWKSFVLRVFVLRI